MTHGVSSSIKNLGKHESLIARTTTTTATKSTGRLAINTPTLVLSDTSTIGTITTQTGAESSSASSTVLLASFKEPHYAKGDVGAAVALYSHEFLDADCGLYCVATIHCLSADPDDTMASCRNNDCQGEHNIGVPVHVHNC